MNLLASPRSPKWPFLLGDLALLLTAFAIGYFSDGPLSAAELALIFGCVALGAVLAAVPFLLDFVASQRDAEADLLARLDQQTKKLVQSTELLANAATALKSVHDATQRALHATEALPYKLQEKIGEIAAQLQQTEDEQREALERELGELREAQSKNLAALAEKVRAATKELAAADRELRPALESALARSAALAPDLAAAAEAAALRLRTAADTAADRLAAALAPAEKRPAQRIYDSETNRPASETPPAARAEPAPTAAPRAVPTPAPSAPPAPVPALAAVSTAPTRPTPAAPPLAADTAPPEPAAAAPASRPPASRRRQGPKAEEVLPGLDPVAVLDATDVDGRPTKPVRTTDGSTRLLATAYIGIGNRVFLRGTGPGLSQDRGVPMEFVSIGKWSWQSTAATGPVRLQFWKNDEVPALGAEIELPPGHQIEVSPVFKEPDPF